MTNSLYDIPFKQTDGSSTSLRRHAGKVLLIVNVASKCGFTPQYDGLQALYQTYRDRGLMVLGFPSNDFAGQEPGTDASIQDFCRLTYGVEFPVLCKISVKGKDIHPLYQMLTSEQPVTMFKPGSDLVKELAEHGLAGGDGEVAWNFEKFLIDRSGAVVGRFGSDIAPRDDVLVDAIEARLAA